ncbi:MAG TPA: ADP-ribosylglycohydrolase family protein [Gemmatimonadaceae bacterium]|nr:ADP-ribosylglycohydrolase family protein [Gemmatimonadaceae bacterium]
MKATRQAFRGCLLGGAIGDALGAPVEFLSRAQIRERFGERGIDRFALAYGRVGAITDDTQMTMFTAEGLLQAVSLCRSGSEERPEAVVHRAYLRWLRTQHFTGEEDASGSESSGWLIHLPALHARRAPGMTCLNALMTGRMGTPMHPFNGSKGCGGVMRIAPCALVKDWDPYELGCKVAAITHGHHSGYLAAGALAVIVRAILEGNSVAKGVSAALVRLVPEPGGAECIDALRGATGLWKHHGPDGDVEELGQGWVADEALAIGVYAAMVGESDLRKGLTLAVNHSGDSDSTGAIAGNILGAIHGDEALSRLSFGDVELRAEIERLADDLFDAWTDEAAWADRYSPIRYARVKQ